MKLDFFAAAEVGEDLFFSAWTMNGIFKMNRNTAKVTYVGRVDEEEIEFNSYRFAHYHDGKIYFIPALGKYIAVLDLIDEHIDTIALPKRERICETVKFAKVLHEETALWLIPMGFDALLRFDLVTEEWKVYDIWPEGIEWEHNKKLQFYTGEFVSNHICMLPREGDYFVSFDMDKKEMQKWELKYPKNAFDAMVFKRGYLWLFPSVDYPYIVKHHIETGQEELIEVQKDVGMNVTCLYAQPIVIGDKIIRAPYQSNHWLVLDTLTDEVEKIKCTSSEYPLCQATTIFKDGIIATSGISGIGQFISNDLQNISKIVYESDEALEQYILVEMTKKNVKSFKEGPILLDKYIKVLLELEEVEEQGSKRENATLGERIYETIISR